MIYFKITGGRYTGFVGRYTGTLGSFMVLLVQARDQWLLAYVRPENVERVRRWGLVLTNGTNYIEELQWP